MPVDIWRDLGIEILPQNSINVEHTDEINQVLHAQCDSNIITNLIQIPSLLGDKIV